MEGGPLLWIWPLYLHVNQKSDDDDDDDASLLNGTELLKERIFSLRRKVFHLRVDSFSEELCFLGSKQKVTKLFPFVNNGRKKHGGVSINLQMMSLNETLPQGLVFKLRL